jgi:hypothetical protein
MIFESERVFPEVFSSFAFYSSRYVCLVSVDSLVCKGLLIGAVLEGVWAKILDVDVPDSADVYVKGITYPVKGAY